MVTSQTVVVSLLLLIPAIQGTTTVSTATSTDSTTNITGSTATSPVTTANTMNMTTNNSSGIENSTTTMSTTTATTATTTTAKPVPDMPHNTDIALYVLSLTVSNDNSSDIQYSNVNLTRDELLNKLNTNFTSISFSTDLQIVNKTHVPAMYVLKVMFLYKNIVNNTENVNREIREALLHLPEGLSLVNPNVTFEKVSLFINSTMDPCAAQNVCPVGYRCLSDGCRHMCSDKDCSSHGMCYISVTTNVTATTMCQCDSEYATEYMGDNCQYSRRGRLQIIAIIAGVLGAACLIFIIIIIVLCVKYNRTSPSSNYNVSGASYGNNAYDNAQEK